jgi:hypothetical protein
MALEAGAGRWAHLAFEALLRRDGATLELRPARAAGLWSRHPNLRILYW